MHFAKMFRRRPRPVGLLSPESLESRALLSAARCDVAEVPVVADVQTHGRHATPRLQVAGDYSFGGDDFGDGSLVITQEGNNIHGEITAPLVQSASFDAAFKKDSAKVAKGTITARFLEDDGPSQAKFKIKFKVQGDDFLYFYKTGKYQPIPM